LLEPGPVTRLLDRHASGAEDHSRELWGLLALTLWLDSDAHHAGSAALVGEDGAR
jgi:hypothetical protein